MPYFLSEGIVYLVMQPREKKSFFLASSKETCGLSGRTNKGKDLKNVPYLFAPLPSQDLVSRDLIAQVSRRPKIPKLGLFDGGGWLRYHFFSYLQDCAENIPIAYASGKRALSNF